MLFRNQKTKRTNFSSPMFPQISKVWSMLYHRSVRRVQSKQCSSLFTDTFFGIFLFLFIKKLVYHFTFFFWQVSNFRNRILTNQKPELVI